MTTEPRFLLFNETDGILVSPELMTKAEAELYEKVFRERFARQGYYASVDGRIPVAELRLRLIPEGDFDVDM